jgi:UDP-N-acetylglucosamine--N-acetylmuramyl-(pentapeptide) pyrophosphoryl-undecaprenol N-acetylglucosamine transferase
VTQEMSAEQEAAGPVGPRPLRVVLAGGGTAGHIEPALALADALRRRDPRTAITALGTVKGLETRLVPERGYDLELIPAVPLPRKPTPDLFTVPSRLAGTVRRAAEVLDRAEADVVVGFGGYVALPAYFAARRRGVPIVIHEANVRPGLANRIGARMTHQIATGSPDCRLGGGRYIGMPLRRSISVLDRAAGRTEAREFFGLDQDQPVVLVYGGSQGARRLNEAIGGAAPQLAEAGIQVLHAVGRGNFDSFTVPDRPNAAGQSEPPAYIALPYLDRMDLAYSAADMVLCRGGAMTCAEVAAVGLPAVYVPLPIGNGEQRLNAQPTVRAGGGLLVDDAELTPQWLVDQVLPLLSDPVRLAAMGKAAAEFGRRDADEALVDMVFSAAHRSSVAAAGSQAGSAGGAGQAGAADPVDADEQAEVTEPNGQAGQAEPIRPDGQSDVAGLAEQDGLAIPAEPIGQSEASEQSSQSEQAGSAGLSGPDGQSDLAELTEQVGQSGATSLSGQSEQVDQSGASEQAQQGEQAGPAGLSGAAGPGVQSDQSAPTSLPEQSGQGEPSSLTEQAESAARGDQPGPTEEVVRG